MELIDKFVKISCPRTKDIAKVELVIPIRFMLPMFAYKNLFIDSSAQDLKQNKNASTTVGRGKTHVSAFSIIDCPHIVLFGGMRVLVNELSCDVTGRCVFVFLAPPPANGQCFRKLKLEHFFIGNNVYFYDFVSLLQ